jgi:hypothetical protein
MQQTWLLLTLTTFCSVVESPIGKKIWKALEKLNKIDWSFEVRRQMIASNKCSRWKNVLQVVHKVLC